MLSACTTPPPVGANEPPDAVDSIRALDLTPRPLQPTPAADTGTGANRPQLYYGSEGGQAGAGSAAPPAGAAVNGEGVSLNFEDAPVSAVAKVILGDILGVGYLIDPRVQGTISLSSGRPIPKSDVLFVLEAALRTANAVVVRGDGAYRIVPADDAVGSGRVESAGGGRATEPGYGTSVVPLRHVSDQTVMKLLDSFAVKPGAIRAAPGRNLILVIGSGIERRAAVETILSFDADWMRGQSVGVFPVQNTAPEPLIAELEKILDSGEEGLSQNMVKFQPVARSNAILVVARKPELLHTAAKWINRLDNSAVASTGVKVYRVRYGDARQIALVLSNLFIGGGVGTFDTAASQLAPGAGAAAFGAPGGTTGFGGTGLGGGGLGGGGLGGGLGGGGLGGGGLGGGGAGGPGGGGGLGTSQTQSQGPFGSLGSGAGQTGTGGALGTTGGDAYATSGFGGAPGGGFGGPGGGIGGGIGGPGGGRALLPGVRILPDIPNNAVVIYANAEQYKIIERALNQLDRPLAQVAIDLTIAEVNLTDQLRYGVQFFLGSINLPGNQLGVQGFNPFNTAMGSGGIPAATGGGEFNLLLGNQLTPHVIISALHAYTTAKILANPSLVVVNNQIATLLVGQNVPVSTGSLASGVGISSVATSIDYRNTGIILRIQPRINANGNVLLDLEQEISQQVAGVNACAGSVTGAPCPTFTNRRVKSTIMVPNGQTVLLAGLIQEIQRGERSGIPVLDQIPFLGEAFTPNNKRNLERTELIIFIRPQIIRDSVDASTVAEELRAKIRGDKIGTLHPPGNVTPYPLGLVQ